MISKQLTLDLGHRPALGRNDFVVAPCNAEAVAWLDQWPDWPKTNGLILVGPPGSGKTHLLASFALAHGAKLVEADTVTIATVPEIVEGARLILVDHLDGHAQQDALFHLHNLCIQNGSQLVFAATQAAGHLGFDLADLVTRLSALPHVSIGPPDDDLLAVVIAKQFADRQVSVTHEVLCYLVSRIERSFAAARSIVDVLDQAALSKASAITIPLARQILGHKDDDAGFDHTSIELLP